MSTRIDAARVAELSRSAFEQYLCSLLAGCAGCTTNQSGARSLRNELFASPRHHCTAALLRSLPPSGEGTPVASFVCTCTPLFVPATGKIRCRHRASRSRLST